MKLVIDENGQGHAMLGNCYWSEQGRPDPGGRGRGGGVRGIWRADHRRRPHPPEGTGWKARACAGPDETFSDRKVEMGDFTIEVLVFGPAHSPGDTRSGCRSRNW